MVCYDSINFKDNWKLIKRTPNGWLNNQFSINNSRLENYKDSVGLYNLSVDKGETKNVAASEPQLLAQMITSLDSLIAQKPK